ncbi:MAG: preprotein translocase subunit YajC [Planctomycetota bacterium]|jgi:preprotein translocase subunit YajC
MNNMLILAQAPQADSSEQITAEPLTGETETTELVVTDSNTAPARPQGKPAGSFNLIILGLMFVVMYFLLFRGPRKKQQQHKQMVSTLKKNDRVRTIGGVIGTVVDVKDDEVTLKVDESNNTKIKVIPSAIGRNLSSGKE